MAFWRDHSRTIIGLTLGTSIITFCLLRWKDGGNWFDVVTIIGAIQLDKGLDGLMNIALRETAKPED